MAPREPPLAGRKTDEGRRGFQAAKLNSLITRTVEFCARHRLSVILVALVLAAVSGTYTARHFAIDTNINNLLSRDLAWRQREIEYQAAFPQSTQLILVVVGAPTPEQLARP